MTTRRGRWTGRVVDSHQYGWWLGGEEQVGALQGTRAKGVRRTCRCDEEVGRHGQRRLEKTKHLLQRKNAASWH